MADQQILDITPEEAELIKAHRNQKEAQKVALKPYGFYKCLIGSHFEALDQKLHSNTTGPFWSASNLTKKFGEDKFRFIKLHEEVEESEDLEEENEEYIPIDAEDDPFSSMTMDQLLQHAAENNINLGKSKTYEAVLKKVRAASQE